MFLYMLYMDMLAGIIKDAVMKCYVLPYTVVSRHYKLASSYYRYTVYFHALQSDFQLLFISFNHCKYTS